MNNPPPIQDNQSVPLERVAKFIRQLTHDVRNGLSAVDLEAAFVEEISADDEVLVEMRKLREMTAETAKMLREISRHFQPPSVHPIQWEAKVVMEELRKRVKAEFPEQFLAIKIADGFGEQTLEIDLEKTLEIVLIVLRNAIGFLQEGAEVRVLGSSEGSQEAIEIREFKQNFTSQIPPEEWGTEPLFSTRPGGYGLGLYHARQIAEAQGGSLQAHFTGDELITRITLPRESAAM